MDRKSKQYILDGEKLKEKLNLTVITAKTTDGLRPNWWAEGRKE